MGNTTDWLNISSQSGSSGETRLTLTARKNLSSDAKYATITAYNPVYNISARTYVSLAAYVVYPIPYTADTTTVSETGETRTITIDTSNLISSSITVSVVGATGITATYDNGVVTVVFPENYEAQKDIDIVINAQTNDEGAAEATISYTQDAGDIHNMPLRFNIANAGNIYWRINQSSAESASIQYRINKGSWTTITSSVAGAYFGVNAGDTVEFIGDNASYGSSSGHSRFASTCNFTVAGNIMSLINSTGYSELSAFTANSTFSGLFSSCTGLTSAENLVLPATTLTDYCYSSMFYGCTSLTTAPELPATTLAGNCYDYMFYGCTSLTSAPTLPATTLAIDCYTGMFTNCTGLTTAPELPAATLAQSCYNYMFNGCTSLTTAPALPATTLSFLCYIGMFNGCTSLTTAPALPATTLATSSYTSMFTNCTSLTTAPALPATTLAGRCYYSMFQGCTSLTTAPELPATTLANGCYYSMFQGCTNLNYIKCLATNISAQYCTTNWVDGVAATGTFVTPSSTNWSTGNDGIPSGWTREDA